MREENDSRFVGDYDKVDSEPLTDDEITLLEELSESEQKNKRTLADLIEENRKKAERRDH